MELKQVHVSTQRMRDMSSLNVLCKWILHFLQRSCLSWHHQMACRTGISASSHQQQSRKKRMMITMFFADLKTHTTYSHRDTHTYLKLWCNGWSPLPHCSCSRWGPWHVLPPLYMRYHKCLPQLLKKDAPLVQLWHVPLRKDLRPKDKCVIGGQSIML